MNIYAGDNALKPAQYTQILALLTTGLHEYQAEDGVTYQVKVTGAPTIAGVLHGVPVISVTLAEPGFDDDSDEFDPEITGTLAGVAFTAKLSDYQESWGVVGEFQRSITGKIIASSTVAQYAIWNLKIPKWSGPSLTVGANYAFNFSYQAENGDTVNKSGSGKLIGAPSLSGVSLSVQLEEDL
jgi:hypothetical protein